MPAPRFVTLALSALLLAAACPASPPAAPAPAAPTPAAGGVPMAFQGDWYGADGRLLRVGEQNLGEWRATTLDGTFASDMFLFAKTAFSGRAGEGECEGRLQLADGGMQVELKGPCEELNGSWGRTAGAAPKAPTETAATEPAPAKQKKRASTEGGCDRYVDCVCDVAIAIRHRGGDESYMASCDAARVLVDLGASDKDCLDGLRQMEGWFTGIERAYPRVEVPGHCRF